MSGIIVSLVFLFFTVLLTLCAFTVTDSPNLKKIKMYPLFDWLWWIVLVINVIASFIGGICFLFHLNDLSSPEPSWNLETEIKCKTINGEFSKALDACYKNGVKINFGESEYEE